MLNLTITYNVKALSTHVHAYWVESNDLELHNNGATKNLAK
jgi:hypothetical protein